MKVPFDHIEKLSNTLTFKFERVGKTTVTGCWAFLPNGFKVAYGESIAFDPEEFTEEKGIQYAKECCINNAKVKLFEFEGYLLKATGKLSLLFEEA